MVDDAGRDAFAVLNMEIAATKANFRDARDPKTRTILLKEMKSALERVIALIEDEMTYISAQDGSPSPVDTPPGKIR
jgi:hypothetical protein